MENELELKAKLFQKLWAVMEEVDYIQKDKSVSIREKKAYNYASEAAIKAAFHKSLVKNRVLFLPCDSQLEPSREVRTTDQYNKERVQILTPVKLFYNFCDVDTGYTYQGAMHGMGGDSLDKGLFKDITGCFKYIFHTSFVLPTGDDPEEGEQREDMGRRKFTKEERASAHAEQQAIAKDKIEQIQAGNVPTSWDWRNALGLYEQYEQRFGKEETKLALLATGLNSLEQTQSREHATEILGKIKKLLIHPGGEPDWAKTKAKSESKLEKAADPLTRMFERMGDFKGRLAVIQQHKFDLVQKYGQKDGERRYYEVLDKQGGHPDTHANEIAKNADKSRATASELYLELHPETVEEEVNA